MPKEDTVIDTKITYKGVFDFELLYLKLREWLLREGYSDPVQDGEKKYAEKVKPFGKIMEIVWESSKEEEKGYFKNLIKISFYGMGINEAEVEREGKVLKLDRGEVQIKFSSGLVRNAKGDWDESSMMFRIYERHIIKDKIEHFKIECYKDTNDLIEEAKNFLNLYSTV